MHSGWSVYVNTYEEYHEEICFAYAQEIINNFETNRICRRDGLTYTFTCQMLSWKKVKRSSCSTISFFLLLKLSHTQLPSTFQNVLTTLDRYIQKKKDKTKKLGRKKHKPGEHNFIQNTETFKFELRQFVYNKKSLKLGLIYICSRFSRVSRIWAFKTRRENMPPHGWI